MMTLPSITDYAKIKGINLLSTGDFTHPLWFEHLKSQLIEKASGIYQVKSRDNLESAKFIIGGEISCIYTQNGKGRRIHIIVLLPNLEMAEKANFKLKAKGCNLLSDGRPIINLSVIELLELLLTIDENIIIIPAHIWTPWFGMLGAKSGFDSLRECCGVYADKILAIETGLSSNPEMNWQVAELNNRSIVSFSDAHSLEKLGRELTIFSRTNHGKIEIKNTKFNYQDLKMLLQNKGNWRIERTVEFYPQEGKYHVDGHRSCGIKRIPEEIKKLGRVCPVCGKMLTPGVLGRVQQLADTPVKLKKTQNRNGVLEYTAEGDYQKPYQMLVPLATILGQLYQVGEKSRKVTLTYDKLIKQLGNELGILSEINLTDIAKAGGEKLSLAIAKVRSGDIFVDPGFDGQFGKVKIWPTQTDLEKHTINHNIQETLF